MAHDICPPKFLFQTDSPFGAAHIIIIEEIENIEYRKVTIPLSGIIRRPTWTASQP